MMRLSWKLFWLEYFGFWISTMPCKNGWRQWLDGLLDWFIDWWIGLLIDWLIDWLIAVTVLSFLFLYFRSVASSYPSTVIPVSYSSKKMETTIGGDVMNPVGGAGGRRSSGTLLSSSSPTSSPVPPSNPPPMRHITSLQSSTTVVQQKTTTTGVVTPASSAGDAATRSPLRLIHETIKTASQESQADSGHGSGHGSTQPPVTTEFQPFFSDINPATESSKLLSTPNRRAEDGDDRPVTPMLGLTASTKMDLMRSKHESAWVILNILRKILLIDRFTHSSIDRLFDCLIDRLFGGSIDWLIDWASCLVWFAATQPGGSWVSSTHWSLSSWALHSPWRNSWPCKFDRCSTR